MACRVCAGRASGAQLWAGIALLGVVGIADVCAGRASLGTGRRSCKVEEGTVESDRGAAEGIAVKMQHSHTWKTCKHLLRHAFCGQVVLLQVQPPQVGEALENAWGENRETVVFKVKHGHPGHAGEYGWRERTDALAAEKEKAVLGRARIRVRLQAREHSRAGDIELADSPRARQLAAGSASDGGAEAGKTSQCQREDRHIRPARPVADPGAHGAHARRRERPCETECNTG